MNLLPEILRAEQRIRRYVRETPLDFSPALSELGGANVYVKLENLQHTGSFKLRGAFNKLLSLTPEQRAAGVITASSGNHGAATAYALQQLGAQGEIFVPETVSATKERMIRRFGGVIRHVGNDSGISELVARRTAEERGLVYISPYNDLQVIAGQGTIGVELGKQFQESRVKSQESRVNSRLSTFNFQLSTLNSQGWDALFVALGGGGLISGIGGYLKAIYPNTKLIACSPIHSNVMEQSVKAGRILDLESLPTLSDGTAGGVEPGSITFDMVRDLVDAYVSVSEAEIADAMRLFLETHHLLIEGAAGVAIASYLQQKERFVGQNVAIIICGANISLARLKEVIG